MEYMTTHFSTNKSLVCFLDGSTYLLTIEMGVNDLMESACLSILNLAKPRVSCE